MNTQTSQTNKAATTYSKITLKLLKDARSNKVLFGEAGKEFVDFMFSLLTLPLGSIIKFLSPSTMTGSIGKLYQSVENLSETYLVANRDKSTLLQPNISTFDVASPLLMGAKAITEQKHFLCRNRKRNFGEVTSSRLSSMPYSSSYGAGNWEESVGGFVKGVITYMITDDLEVTPISAISTITLINRYGKIKDLQLEEKVVTIGMKEGLVLLKASLDSPTVLTDVFCSSK